MKLLLVEDDETQRQVIEKILKARWPEAQVLTAKDGFEAGIKTAESQPDALVLDVNIPGLDGFWVCRALRTNPRLSATRILAMSGDDNPELRARILGAGADDFIPKPFGADELAQRLKALLDKKA